MKYWLTALICCIGAVANAQHSFKAIIKSERELTPLAGATVVWHEGKQTFIADTLGHITINNIPDGKQQFTISYTEHEKQTLAYTFPLTSDAVIEIYLKTEHEEHEEEEVIVTATRTSRTIANTPTRVEIISGEELEEKGNMKPGDIRMLLNESTGIQTQQTSATSYNSSIRIQGLDGRYTQLLRDGIPLYSGFAGGLSIMQIAPLDLKQVEVIKGSSSTLYGGGAIAGLVNLVSKVPTAERELSFMANATTAKGLDLSGFYSQRFNKFGLTFFGSRNSSNAYDPADIGLTAIPEFERYTINPRLFFYGRNTSVVAGASFITEDRTGGSLDYIKRGTAGYFEQNKTDRFTTEFRLEHALNEKTALQFKNSYSRFNRSIGIPSYRFEGQQQSSFSEATFNTQYQNVQWIAGLNVITDHFNEEPFSNAPLRNYEYTTLGAFIQNTWSPVEHFTLETGLRGDYTKTYGFELLPRLSALFKLSPAWTARIGGGLGYKTPTVFNEEAERIHFQNILPINNIPTENERSIGGNADINFRTSLGAVGLSINQLFFYTRLRQPLLLHTNDQGNLAFANVNGHIETKGIETNVKLTYSDFKLFVGYTYADVNSHKEGTKQWFPLTARHRLNNVLMYEIEEKLKLGLEAYYVSRQRLSDGTTGQSYWITGFMAEKLWEKFSLFVNFENFTDTRQTRFDTIYTGPINNPQFRDIYAPVDGFVVNGGIKVRL